jgi:hypothetical protein
MKNLNKESFSGAIYLKPFWVFAIASFALWFCIAPPVWAQDIIYVYDGTKGDQLGLSVSGAGDVNGDGYADFIVGAYGNDSAGDNAGRAYVYSGLTGYLLYIFDGEAAYDYFGYSVSGAGDVNGDGFDDLIVGAYDNSAGGILAGRAYVYSGQSGALLWTFTGKAAGEYFGYSVSGAGDVNNDGYADLIVGAYENDAGGHNAGRAYVYSGKTGDTLFTITGESANDQLGYSVSGSGDVNGDGYADLIVGAPGYFTGGVNTGRAYIYSGLTEDTLFTIIGSMGSQFGYSVSGAGDVNGDGYPDLIVGEPYGYSVGRASVYSGPTGDLLNTFTGEAADDRFGLSVSGAGDVNNDGYADLIVGAPFNDERGSRAGKAYIYSGESGDILFTLLGESADNLYGISVSGVGDLDGNGFDEVIVGAHFYNNYSGRAYVYSSSSLFSYYLDLGVTVWGSTRARPGFQKTYIISYYNYKGKDAEGVILRMYMSYPPEVSYVSAYPSPSFESSSMIEWDLGTVPGLSGGSVNAVFYISPSAPAGIALTVDAEISDVNGSLYEFNMTNNSCSEHEESVTSWDPNDKEAQPWGGGTAKYIAPDRMLRYTIFFENDTSATAEAIYVNIVDTLSIDLDWSTLEIGPMSHPDTCQASFDTLTGVLIWDCDSIMLPPDDNPPEGEGFVSFSIMPDSGLSVGTEIRNQAHIQFDYNPWIAAPGSGPVIRTIGIYGDADGNGGLSVSDVIYMINYLFKGGAAPSPSEIADCNCDMEINISDSIYLINYLFKGGPAPEC